MIKVRIEKDTLGKVKVPKNAYYGAQTQRAIENFPISGLKPHIQYVYSVVMIKKASARVNTMLKLLDSKRSLAIQNACDEILEGKYSDQFVVDPYQAGAGTSHNMNINEVIANRANEILDAPLGSYRFIHPNDHINMSQSTNDVIPTAIRITALYLLPNLITCLKKVEEAIMRKSKEFSKIIKPGRTHLQDALPITLGQEFGAYAEAIYKDRLRIEQTSIHLRNIGIGGTAVGTGVNTHPEYHYRIVLELKKLTNMPLISNGNLFESMQNTADFLDVSSSLRILSQTLTRIGNDLRLLSSGPNTGLSEITLPPVQPGSSIMPGKTNPSIVEMLTMVCFQVIGYDTAIMLAIGAGQLELNVMIPLIAYNLFEQIRLLTNALEIFEKKFLNGISVNEKMCAFWSERNAGVAAILNRYLGYDKAAEVVRYALSHSISIPSAVIDMHFLPKKTVRELFASENLTQPTKNSAKTVK